MHRGSGRLPEGLQKSLRPSAVHCETHAPVSQSAVLESGGIERPSRRNTRSKRSIAFISTYDHPSRDSVEAMLREAFPEFNLEIFSTTALIKKHRRWWFPNSRFVAAEYGARLARGTIDLKTAYMQTSYVMRRLRESMGDVLDPARHAFSFQTQSMFDTSVPGVPHYIYTDHTHLSNLSSEYFDQNMLRSEAWRLLERAAYHNCSCVFTRSTDVTRDLIELYDMPASKTQCVRAGANVKPAAIAAGTANAAGRRILFVGLEWERKGGPILAKAFVEVLRAVPDAQLTIVGANPKLKLPNCEVLGPLPIDRLSENYSRASIFCLPTRLEPFGIAFLEAMAHKLPVIGTRIGAIPDMVLDGETGILVKPDNPQQLAEALITLLRDPARCSQLGKAGYEHLSKRYTWNSVGAGIRGRILRDLGVGA
jgi:glycosyltransferase involved in cell wall biosynthesis